MALTSNRCARSAQFFSFIAAMFFFCSINIDFIQEASADSVMLVPQKSKSKPAAPDHIYDEDVANNRQGASTQIQLLNQVQQLQEEVQQLRGIVEEQVYILDQLKKTTKEQYLDLDNRISKSPAKSDISNDISEPSQSDSSSETVPSDLSKAKPAEKKLYDEAQASIRSRDYQKAVDKLNSLLTDHPDGAYVSYAHYWLGEVNLALPEPQYQEAEIHFLKLLQRDAKHAKAPAALFKLGKLYDLTNQPQLSDKYFKRVIQQYPDDPAATLAKRYLEVIHSREKNE